VFWLLWNLRLLEISQIRHSKCGSGTLYFLTDGQVKKPKKKNAFDVYEKTQELTVIIFTLTTSGLYEYIASGIGELRVRHGYGMLTVETSRSF
jgi:hypothetical protein